MAPVDTISDNMGRRLPRTAWNRVGMWNRVDGRYLAGVKSRIMVAQWNLRDQVVLVYLNEASFRIEQAKSGCHAEQMGRGRRAEPMELDHQMEQAEHTPRRGDPIESDQIQRGDGYLDESSFQRNQPFSGQEQRNTHRANRTKNELLCVGCSNRNQRRNLIEYRRIRTHL